MPKRLNNSHKTQALGGVVDIIAQTNPIANIILKRLQKTGRTYGFLRIETPVLEESQVYQNYFKNASSKLAESLTVAVENKQYVVRSAFLPSVLKAYLQNKIFESQPVSKWMYFGNVIRTEGRGGLISDYEFGMEIFGEFNHLAEAQVISATWHMLMSLGLESATLEINNIGNAECQENYQDALRDYLKGKKFDLCDSCNEHLTGRTLNIFRCSNLDCQLTLSEAPTILDFLDQDSHKHFTNILEALDELEIPYQLNPFYVGPDGSSNTNLAIKYKQGDQSFIVGEASYHNELLKNLGGKNYSAFGFVGSFSSMQRAMHSMEIDIEQELKHEVVLVPLGELASKKSLKLFRDLVRAEVKVYDHFGHLGVKNQLKQAELSKSPIALIMGQKEAMDEMVILRDVKSGMQEVFSYDKIVEEVLKRLGK